LASPEELSIICIDVTFYADDLPVLCGEHEVVGQGEQDGEDDAGTGQAQTRASRPETILLYLKRILPKSPYFKTEIRVEQKMS
jgi:hypothetical protein